MVTFDGAVAANAAPVTPAARLTAASAAINRGWCTLLPSWSRSPDVKRILRSCHWTVGFVRANLTQPGGARQLHTAGRAKRPRARVRSALWSAPQSRQGERMSRVTPGGVGSGLRDAA